jgi:hypothetical protein
MKRRIQRNDEGASLILVIIFVMVFAVVIGAVLDFAGAGFETTEKVIKIRNTQHAVDGAMDGAINAIRGRRNIGREDSVLPCPDYVYDSDNDADPTVTVECSADALGSSGNKGDFIPTYAILTGLWRDGSDPACMGFHQTGSNELLVDGGIFSNGVIAVNKFPESSNNCEGVTSGNGKMSVFSGDALAFGECSPKDNDGNYTKIAAFGGGVVVCDGDALDEDAEEDLPDYEPDYASASDVAGAGVAAQVADVGNLLPSGYVPSGYDPLPVCNPYGNSGPEVMFVPGVYTEIPKYLAEVECGLNNGDIWWFSPGTYYFDFPADDATWQVNPYNIIGGTLKTPNNLTSFRNGSDDRACWSVEDEPTNTAADQPGVQFIFGGPSRLTSQGVAAPNTPNPPPQALPTGVINLCAGVSPNTAMKQRLAVYALHPEGTGQNARPPLSEGAELEHKIGGPTGSFADPGNARSDDTARATKSFTAPGDDIANVVFSDFADLDQGSYVDPDKLRLEIRHDESGLEDMLTKTVALTFPSGTATIDLEANNNGCTPTTPDGPAGDTVETCELDFLEDPFLWKELNGLTATYTVDASELEAVTTCAPGPPPKVCTTTDEATATLNSIRITLDYQAPGFEPQDSITGDPNDPDVPDKPCALPNWAGCFLYTEVNPVVLFKGTFFAPYADLAINVHNDGVTEFSRGVIANHIEGDASASSKQTSAPFSLPGSEMTRVTLFEAYVDDKLRLRARVSYDDLDVAGQVVHIWDWAVIRD